jgi:3'-phosphoadenosine 5'-phosphosulfate sulfotransferase (PAPS reductase)/FAD synthetase
MAGQPTAIQDALLPVAADPAPDLRAYDAIIVASSGGKDSEVTLDVVAEQADDQDVMDRVTVLHNDLGEVEWPGTEELARQQAELYGFRFEMRHREQGLLLPQIVQRKATLLKQADAAAIDPELTPAQRLAESERLRNAAPWPSSAARFCTSDQKRAPGRRLITELVGEMGIEWTGSPPRPVRQARILYCMGLRAAESSGRKKKPCMTVDSAASSGVREVTTWLPIRQWSDEQVWQRICDHRLPYHWAYDGRMERLSCSLCVLATFEDCVTAVRLRPEIGQTYLALENKVGHSFRVDFSIAQVVAEAERRGPIHFERGDAIRRHLGDAAAELYLTT